MLKVTVNGVEYVGMTWRDILDAVRKADTVVSAEASAKIEVEAIASKVEVI